MRTNAIYEKKFISFGEIGNFSTKKCDNGGYCLANIFIARIPLYEFCQRPSDVKLTTAIVNFAQLLKQA